MKITAAVRISYDRRTDRITITGNPLPPQVRSQLANEPYTIEDDQLIGWGYSHRISVDPMLSYDLAGDYLVTFDAKEAASASR